MGITMSSMSDESLVVGGTPDSAMVEEATQIFARAKLRPNEGCEAVKAFVELSSRATKAANRVTESFMVGSAGEKSYENPSPSSSVENFNKSTESQKIENSANNTEHVEEAKRDFLHTRSLSARAIPHVPRAR
jgi:hypothetical protein